MIDERSLPAMYKLTGYRFFTANVPDDLAQSLREQVDDVTIRLPRPKRGG
jgi:hypothetical protein